MPAGVGVELLGVQAQRRGHREQALHEVARALALADDGQGRDEPERADEERALLARQPVVGLAGLVAQHEAVLGELVGDGQHARAQALVVVRAGSRTARRAGSRRRARRSRSAGAARRGASTPCSRMSALISSRGRGPGRAERRLAGDMGQLRRAIERHPAHELRRDVVLGVAARLPDPLVGLAPDRGRALGLRLHDRPQPARQPVAAPRVQQDRVQRGAEDVVLALVEGAVADADRARAGVAGEVVARGLGEIAAPVDPVHDLQRAVLVGLEVGDELHELVGLPVEVEVVQRLQGEGGVAHPRVAVVPVALAARRLGQRRGQRGHRRAGGHVGQALDRQRGALDRRHPLVIGKPGAGEPRAPEAGGLRQARVGVVEVGR